MPTTKTATNTKQANTLRDIVQVKTEVVKYLVNQFYDFIWTWIKVSIKKNPNNHLQQTVHHVHIKISITSQTGHSSHLKFIKMIVRVLVFMLFLKTTLFMFAVCE